LGDRVTLHAQRDGLHVNGFQTLIGDNAVGIYPFKSNMANTSIIHNIVGSHSVINGATLEDNSFVDVSCTICNGAVVGQYAVIGPGSVLLSDARVKSKTVFFSSSIV
jgi:carbonic anhydrase/acetyltransferase-like protein (isoleucine patch superfamily)